MTSHSIPENPLVKGISEELQKKNPSHEELSRLLLELERSNPDIYNARFHVIKEAKTKVNAMRRTLDVITADERIEIRRALLTDSRLKKELQKLGIKVEGDSVSIPEGFEKTPECRQIKLYLTALKMTSDPEYTSASISDAQRKEKVKMYRSIVEESGDFALAREYVGYKLIHSIFQDLKRDPSGPFMIVRSGVQGEYTIASFPITRKINSFNVTSGKAPKNHPYWEVLKSGTVRSDYVDFAMLYSVVEANHTTFKSKEFVGQATLVQTIIDNNGIKGISGQDLQEKRTLLVDWDIVKKDINDKMNALTSGDDENIRRYEELAYLKNLIEGEEHLSKDRNLRMFQEINTYGKAFLVEKALIDDRVGRHTGGIDKTGFGAQLKDGVNGVALPIVALGIFSMIFGGEGTKKFGFMAIAGLLGINAAGGLIDKFGEKIGNPLTGEKAGDVLELIKIRELKYGIKGGTEINTLLEKLYGENDTRLSNRTTTSSTDIFVKDPLIIGKILHEISQDDSLLALDASDIDIDSKIYNTLSAAGKLTVTGNEFISSTSKNPTVTKKDVQAFVELLRSQSDTNDTTLGDVLVAGDKDILNKNYENFNFTIDSNFDVALNDHLKARWAANSTSRDGRKKIEALQKSIEAKISSGFWADDWWDSAGERTTTDVWNGLPKRLEIIEGLISDITGTAGLGAATTDALIKDPDGILHKYKTYLKADAEVANYDGKGATVIGAINGVIESVDQAQERWRKVTDIAELSTEKSQIDAQIAKLDPTNFEVDSTSINLSTDPLYTKLVERIQRKRTELQSKSIEIQKTIDQRNTAFINTLTGVTVNPTIENLEKDESSDEYRESITKTIQAIDDFKSIVQDFERTGNVATALGSSHIENYLFLKQAKEKLESLTLAGPITPPGKLWLRVEVQKVFQPSKEAEKYELLAKEKFDEYFTNIQTVNTQIATLSPTFTDVDDFNDKKDILERIESRNKVAFGWTESVYKYIAGGIRDSEFEKAYKTSKEVFGAGFSVPNDTLTAHQVAVDVIEKRREVTQGVKTYINSIPTSNYNLDTLAKLKEIQSRGSLDFVVETELGIRAYTPGEAQIETDYALKVQDIGVSVINNIPATSAGIDDMIKVADMFQFNDSAGLWQRIKKVITGTTHLEDKFNEKVNFIGLNILGNFTEDMTGLNDIVDFKTDSSYLWINGKMPSFESTYNQRVTEIQEAVQNNTLVRNQADLSTIVTSVQASMPGSIPGTTGPNPKKLELGSFVSSGSSKTITLLITTLGLGSGTPSGDFNGYTEIERMAIYNKLKELHIIN